MRITNKIMQRNSLNNINTNKILQDDLTTQMSTQKKINRASDDPVVAIRALRLRSNVTEVTQYYDKNIPDAQSWLDITEDALKNNSTIVTKMIEQATKGANGDLTSSDRQIILEQLEALSDEIYATGDASYAGRYVFTGYRTDTSLSFQKENIDTTYTITEQLDKSAIDQQTHVNIGYLSQWTNANYATNTNVAGVNETQVKTTDIYRFRLSYDELDGVEPTIVYYTGSGTIHHEGDPVQDKNGSQVYDNTGAAMTYKEGEPEKTAVTASYTTLSTASPFAGASDPYEYITQNPNETILLTDTGELLIGKNVYDSLMATKDDSTTSAFNESEIQVTYTKTKFDADDLRPEHYFACTGKTWKTDSSGAVTGVVDHILNYNQNYLDGNVDKQSIEYDVGFNQTIRVNTTADEAFNLGIGRETTDLINSLRELQNLEDLQNSIQNKISVTTDATELGILNNQLTATEKALTYAKDTCQKRFESAITSYQGYLNDTSLAITGVGTRSSKLELIESRMQNQKTTFETLKSKNEDIDITEVAIQLSSAELTYEAALTATGKIIQNTLLNYI